MSNIKKTLLEGVEIKQSPAIVEFLEWYEDNSILTEEEAEGIEGSIIEQDTIKDIVRFFHDNKHYDEIASEETLVDVFAKVLSAMVDDSVYNAFQAVTEFAEVYDCSINDIDAVAEALEEVASEDEDEATKYYGAFQTLSDEDTIDALVKIAAVVASPQLDSLLTEMTNGDTPSKIASYVDGAEDNDLEDDYIDSYDRIGLDDDTLTAVMKVASIVSENTSISVPDLYVKILQDEPLLVGLLDSDGDATFTDEDVTKIMKEFNAVEVNESIEDSIERGLTKLQEQAKQLSRAPKKKSM
jgi:phosphohistidine swiveling domain-containing protein